VKVTNFTKRLKETDVLKSTVMFFGQMDAPPAIRSMVGPAAATPRNILGMKKAATFCSLWTIFTATYRL
jgi:F0F1-type ATP synthase beta subunit